MIVFEGTTPTVMLTGPEGTDFTELGTCRIDIVQGKRRIVIEDAEVAERTIAFSFTEEQTLSLAPDVTCALQVNFKRGRKRVCTVPVRFMVRANLYDEVM